MIYINIRATKLPILLVIILLTGILFLTQTAILEKQSTESGDAITQFKLGVRYYQGNGVIKKTRNRCKIFS